MDKDRTWYLMGKKVAGEATAAEMAELERLLRETPEARYTMEVLASVWKLSEKPEDQAMAEMAFRHQWARLESKTAQQVHTPTLELYRWKRAVVAVAAMFVCFTALWFLLQRSFKSLPLAHRELVTHKGSRSKLLLPDGSSVWLNAGSKLTYAADGDAAHVREVTLAGEGYFEVAPMPGKPFIIHTSDIQVNVLGTVVNVRAYPEDELLETTLISGSVAVEWNDLSKSAIYLRPNQKMIVRKVPHKSLMGIDAISPTCQITVVRPIALHHKTLNPEISWVNNTLVFQDESFLAAVVKMERWYNCRITLADKKLASFHFTGTFEDESLEQALMAMQCIHPFHFKIMDSTVSIY
ncbi:FecR family protein [Chitinophaga costaii]|uniref:FecR family protein n=1 Tax=Chitinophaga costaii TaxID=1335309 RepID=A0A1C4CK17_9BACT|nr:FecR domain-containing protein [Chitinophaga costaii]PUZ27059.1 FecR family protein [Chitinophaga costaii]SCC19409.1 FecR family protein [Chitinophaga costaii]